MNLSRDKSKVQDPGELDSIHGRANPALDGGIDYRPSPRRLHECQFANQEHTVGKTFVRIRMPNVHSKKLISIVSSRIGKYADQRPNWFDAIRTLAIQQGKQNNFIVTAPGTTTFPYLCRLSELFGLTLVLLAPLFKQFHAKPSTSRQNCLLNQFPKATVLYAFYDWQHKTGMKVNCPPSSDQLMINISQECYVISCRRNGIVHEALKNRLRKRNFKRTRLLIDRKLTPQRVSVELINQGAIPWWLYQERQLKRDPQPSQQDSLGCPSKESKSLSQTAPAKTQPNRRAADRQYLIHWTRQSTGPWPDQSYREFLDDLIFHSPSRGEGGFSTLKRILAQHTIRGTNTLTKGSEKVTCLTAVPLSQYANRRIFRSHLSRWDFEHYGIAIDCEFLKKLGARQVFYGTQQNWNRLESQDRPFFQLKNSTNGNIDWRAEREWRLRGDLDLDKVPSQLAFVFVKTKQERVALQTQSQWPVVTVEVLKNLNLHR
ncbi:MAG: hypothetical protein ACR2NK_11655 [Mariniblastus sp.]